MIYKGSVSLKHQNSFPKKLGKVGSVGRAPNGVLAGNWEFFGDFPLKDLPRLVGVPNCWKPF